MWGLGRRLRGSFGIGSSRMAIRSQHAWYWRWLLNVLMMALVAVAVWWLVQNSYRITGSNIEEVRHQIISLTEENRTMKRDLGAARSSLIERDRQLQIDKASQAELARTMAQLQEENASLKEDLGFLRNIMSSGATPEGLGVSNLKVERDGKANEYRYRMLLTQGGQRKQDFKGRIQIVARVAKDGALTTLTFPEASAADSVGSFEFRFYQKVEGRFAIPDGTTLRGRCERFGDGRWTGYNWSRAQSAVGRGPCSDNLTPAHRQLIGAGTTIEGDIATQEAADRWRSEGQCPGDGQQRDPGCSGARERRSTSTSRTVVDGTVAARCGPTIVDSLQGGAQEILVQSSRSRRSDLMGQ